MYVHVFDRTRPNLGYMKVVDVARTHCLFQMLGNVQIIGRDSSHMISRLKHQLPCSSVTSENRRLYVHSKRGARKARARIDTASQGHPKKRNGGGRLSAERKSLLNQPTCHLPHKQTRSPSTDTSKAGRNPTASKTTNRKITCIIKHKQNTLTAAAMWPEPCSRAPHSQAPPSAPRLHRWPVYPRRQQ